MSKLSAQVVYEKFLTLAPGERAKFFALLATPTANLENFSHAQVFGHLANDAFTAVEAAEYLEVSISTFRRYVGDGRILTSGAVGRNQLFSTKELKAFKRSLNEVKARAALAA